MTEALKRAISVRRGGAVTGDVELSYAERYVRRRTLTTATGETFLLDLAEPTDLRHGDGLVLEGGAAIRVVAAPFRRSRRFAPGPVNPVLGIPSQPFGNPPGALHREVLAGYNKRLCPRRALCLFAVTAPNCELELKCPA